MAKDAETDKRYQTVIRQWVKRQSRQAQVDEKPRGEIAMHEEATVEANGTKLLQDEAEGTSYKKYYWKPGEPSESHAADAGRQHS